jgi:hypothetical protein
MASSKAQSSADAPWRRRTEKPVPLVGVGTMVSVRQAPNFSYAMSIMKHPDPIGTGLALEVAFEPAGPDCIVPGLSKPVKLLGVKVWPVEGLPNLRGGLKPLLRELKNFSAAIDRVLEMSSPR